MGLCDSLPDQSKKNARRNYDKMKYQSKDQTIQLNLSPKSRSNQLGFKEINAGFEKQQYLKILGLKKGKECTKNQIDSCFRQKMIDAAADRDKRIKLNISYLYALSNLMGTPVPQLLQKIASGQTDLVQQILKNNKQLINEKLLGYAPIVYATISGHEDIVQLLITMGCSMNFNDQETTPLHYAAYYGHAKIIELLIKNGAKTNVKNSQNKLPIDQCPNNQIRQAFIKFQNAEKVKISNIYNKQQDMVVLEEPRQQNYFNNQRRNITPNGQQQKSNRVNEQQSKFQKIKTYFRQRMIEASRDGDFQQMARLNVNYLKDCQKIYKVKYPQILWAIATGQAKQVERMINQDKSLLNSLIYGYVPLYYAARSGHYEVVESLLGMNCSLNFEGQKSTPMHSAAYYGHIKILKLMMQYGVPTNMKNSSNNLPIDDCPNEEVRRFFIKFQKQFANNKIKYYDQSAVRIILPKSGRQNLYNGVGKQTSTKNRQFLNFGNSPRQQKYIQKPKQQQKFSKNFDHYAFREPQKNIGVVKKQFREQIMKASGNFQEMVRLNVNYLRDCQKIYNSKYPPIIWAIATGQAKQVQRMINQDRSLLNYLIYGYVPLYYAARSGYPEIVELLLRMNCSLNFQGQKSTPMHSAAYFGHKDIIILLMQYGVPANIKNQHGHLPADECANREVLQILNVTQSKLEKRKTNKWF